MSHPVIDFDQAGRELLRCVTSFSILFPYFTVFCLEKAILEATFLRAALSEMIRGAEPTPSRRCLATEATRTEQEMPAKIELGNLDIT